MPNEVVERIDSGAGPKYNEDVNLLDQDDILEEKEDKEEKGEEIEDESPEEEEKEVEEEKIDINDDDKKPDIIYDRPSVSEIKAAFPDLFKKFPSLRDAFYREVEFTKLFPTVEDAKEAFEDNEAFGNLRESVLEGNSEPLLAAIETQNKESIGRFSRNFIQTLYEKNNDVYIQLVTPLFENLLRSVGRSTDENERNAAAVISNFLFGTTEVAEGKKTFTKKIEEVKNVKESPEIFTKHISEVGNKANGILAVIIDKDIDPNKVFTPFVRKQVIREIIDKVQSQLAKDPSHMAVMNSRWKRAKLDNFSEDSKAKIISTFLARAKSILPSVRNEVVKDALGSQKKNSEVKESKISNTIERKEVVGGHKSSTSNSNKNGKVDYSKMTDAQILDMD